MKMADGRKARAILCERYDNKCLTRKCPLSKFNCYDYPQFDVFYLEMIQARKDISRIVKETLDEQIQCKES